MITETLHGFGSWELELSDDIPDDVLTQVGFLGHVVVVDGPVDVAATGQALLAGARYVGVCRTVAKPGSYTRDGDGLLFWLADEDGKGHFIETAISLTNGTLAAWVAALLPPTVTVGTVHPQPDPVQTLTESFIYKTRTEALDAVCDVFGVELRVNGTFAVDVGTAAQLYEATLPLTTKPSPIVVRKAAGSDIDMEAVGGRVQTEGDGRDYSTRVLVVGETLGTADVPSELFVTATASAPTVPYKDPQGGTFKATRVISQSSETSTTAAATAALNLNRFARTKTAVKVTAEDYETEGAFRVGDAAYVYDPDSGITDPTQQVYFRGEVLHPAVIRVAGHTWPIVDGYTVAWRTDAGVWLDLTPWVVWETAGSHELLVGDLPRALTRGTSNPVTDRVDAARGDSRDPKAPTGLTLSTSSSPNLNGFDAAIITAEWNPVTQNTDDTTASIAHYEVQQRPTSRAPLWFPGGLSVDADAELPVVAALSYDVRVRAVSTSGRVSAWSATATILSAADSTAPAAPSDPVLSPYLGLLRITWDGLNNVGGPMPADFNRVDVHVGTTDGFVASQATLVTSLSTAGSHPVYAPYLSPRYVRFIAYDHNQNPSAASGTISGSTVQAADGDIQSLNVGKLSAGIMSADVVIGGRFATALTGARREVNAVGFQGWDASNNLTISLDGSNNLLTGKFQTALTGRRMVTGSGGSIGQLQFFAPDGTMTMLRGYTATTGVEAIGLSVPIAGASGVWNALSIDNAESLFLTAKFVNVIIGGASSGANREFRVDYAPDKADVDLLPRDLRLLVNPDSVETYFNGTSGHFRVWEDPPSGGNLLRFEVTPTGVSSYFDTAGGEHVIFERPASGTTVVRMWIDGHDAVGAGWTRFYNPFGAGAIFYQRNADGSLHSRFQYTDTQFTLGFASTQQRTILTFVPGTITNSSALTLLNSSNFGVGMFYNDSGGVNPRAEFKDAGFTIYIPLWASAFVVSSSETGKDNVRPLEAGARATLRGMEIVKFQRKAGRKAKRSPDTIDEDGRLVEGPPIVDDGPEMSGRTEIGVIAERAPAEITVIGGDHTPMVDLGATVFLGIAAQQETDRLVDELIGRVTELERKVKTA